MTDLARNTRTLIVCFSLAVFGLIPLRFVEISQQVTNGYGEATVLGETQTLDQLEVVLPDADIENSSEYVPGDLEAPYNEIDGGVLGVTLEREVDCMSKAQVDEAVSRLGEGLMAGIYDDYGQIGSEILWLNDQLCR